MDDLFFSRKNLIQQLVLNKVKDLQQAIILSFLYTGQYIHYIWSSDALVDLKMYKNALNIVSIIYVGRISRIETA